MNILKALTFTFGFFLTLLPLSSYAQCTRTSNNGKYTVDILLTSVDVVNISANPCPNGYSLNISIDILLVLRELNHKIFIHVKEISSVPISLGVQLDILIYPIMAEAET